MKAEPFAAKVVLPCVFGVGFVFFGALTAHAAGDDVSIRLRPHCTSEVQCREFVLYDTETMITDGLKLGDGLDLDVVITNPSGQPIQSVQSWLSYDQSVLQGVDIQIGDSFPLVAPGEQEFDESKGIAMIGASNVSGGADRGEIVVARIKFNVISQNAESRIKFNGFSMLGQEGKTKALVVEGGRTINVLRTRPRDLILYFGNDPPPSILIGDVAGKKPTGSDYADNAKPFEKSALPGGAYNDFAVLQPTGLRIMTNNSDVYVLWQPLADGRVRGYNVYYGTVSGKYINRRTVSAASQDGVVGAAIRGLPSGERYFFSVSAFDASQNETEFSYEVAVTVGDASSSTAPFVIDSAAGANPVAGAIIARRGKVPGSTGLPVYMLLVSAAAAGSCSYFLLRRNKA